MIIIINNIAIANVCVFNIESTNQYVDVIVYPLSDVVYCHLLAPQRETVTACSIVYGFGDSLTECQSSLNITQENTTWSLSQNNVTFFVPELIDEMLFDQRGREFCFVIMATFSRYFTVVINGSFNLNGIISSETIEFTTVTGTLGFNEAIENQTITIAIVLCVTMAIFLIATSAIVVLIVMKFKGRLPNALNPRNR